MLCYENAHRLLEKLVGPAGETQADIFLIPRVYCASWPIVSITWSPCCIISYAIWGTTGTRTGLVNCFIVIVELEVVNTGNFAFSFERPKVALL